MKKLLSIMLIGVLAAFLLTSCGEDIKVPEDVLTTSISIDSEGVVTEYLVDTFDRDYYNIDELRAMATEEAGAFNSENKTGEENPINILDVKLNSVKDVVVSTTYDNADTFTAYTGSMLFYGTVEEAMSAGIDLQAVIKDVDDGTVLGEDKLEDSKSRHIIITDAQAVIYAPYSPSYISDGAVYDSEKKTVDTADAGRVVIILSK